MERFKDPSYIEFVGKKHKILFSGRFDPPHPGHIATIIRLCEKYDSVKVVVLDYPERNYPVFYTMAILEELLDRYKVQVMANSTHFAKLTREEWESFDCESYAAGNLRVLKHMEKLGVKAIYVDRAYDYAASDYKRLD